MLQLESFYGLAQLVSLPMQPGDLPSFPIRPLLQGRGPFLGPQLEIPLHLQLSQEVDGPLAGLGILLDQLVPLLSDRSGHLLVPLHPRQ